MALAMDAGELEHLDAHWRAANYLSTPGLNFVCAHLNRLIRARALRQAMADERLRHRAYTRDVGDDPPDVRDWTWPHPARGIPS
jgi:phosphoketolase